MNLVGFILHPSSFRSDAFKQDNRLISGDDSLFPIRGISGFGAASHCTALFALHPEGVDRQDFDSVSGIDRLDGMRDLDLVGIQSDSEMELMVLRLIGAFFRQQGALDNIV